MAFAFLGVMFSLIVEKHISLHVSSIRLFKHNFSSTFPHFQNGEDESTQTKKQRKLKKASGAGKRLDFDNLEDGQAESNPDARSGRTLMEQVKVALLDGISFFLGVIFSVWLLKSPIICIRIFPSLFFYHPFQIQSDVVIVQGFGFIDEEEVQIKVSSSTVQSIFRHKLFLLPI